MTALAATASGDAIVGGEVRGPIKLAGRRSRRTERPRGFIARVSRGGAFRIIQLAEKETFAVPSALAVDRAGRIVVSYESESLEVMTPDGRHVWSRDLPPARALAFARQRRHPRGRLPDHQRMRIEPVRHRHKITTTRSKTDYVARISSWGEIRWTDRLDRGEQAAVLSPERSLCDRLRDRDRARPGRRHLRRGRFRAGGPDRTDDGADSAHARQLPRARRGRWADRLVAARRVRAVGRVALAATRRRLAGRRRRPGRAANETRRGAAPRPRGVRRGRHALVVGRDRHRPAALEPESRTCAIVWRGAKPAFVCVGSYGAPIEIGASKLESPAERHLPSRRGRGGRGRVAPQRSRQAAPAGLGRRGQEAAVGRAPRRFGSAA